MSEALVLLSQRQPLLLLKAKFYCVESLIRKTDQIRSDAQRELTECDLAVRLVTQASQNRIHVLFEDLLLELEQEVFDVLEI